jgi:hypothetical protein
MGKLDSGQPHRGRPALELAKPAGAGSVHASSAGKDRRRLGIATARSFGATARPPCFRRSITMPADLHDLIAQRAYELWQQEGRPDGRAWQHWLQAERELQVAGRESRVYDPYSFEVDAVADAATVAAPDDDRASRKPGSS